MKDKIVKTWPYLLAIIGLLAALSTLSYHHLPFVKNSVNAVLPIGCEANYDLINTEIACGQTPAISKLGYAETQREITKFIEKEKSEGKISEVGIYFRDLESGPVFGYNETTEFAPASLLKLPLALAYFNLSQDNPELLDKNISFQTSLVGASQYFKPEEQIQSNTQYSIRDLIRRALVYSDNVSAALLEDYLTQIGKGNAINETYVDLGLISADSAFDDTLSVRRYGSIFRVLYNVSYLNADLNEEILQSLVESKFINGLEAGVPEEIRVANKFGERVDEASGIKQLHDCGIVYYPKNPYLLCVMSRGKDFEELSKFISEISEIVYEEVNSRKIE